MNTPTATRAVNTPRSDDASSDDASGTLAVWDQGGAHGATDDDAARLWDDLVREHWAYVYALSYRLTHHHEDAEDLTQEVFTRAWQRLDPRTVSVVRGWLYRVTLNMYVDDYRRAHRHPVHPLTPELLDKRLLATTSTKDEASIRKLPDYLEGALNQLRPQYRAVVLLSVVGGYSYDEIAMMLQLKRGTVASCMHRGRAELHRRLRHRPAG